MEIIDVKIEQDSNTKEFIVNFTNQSDTPYFMDQMRVFKSGKYTLDCLKVFDPSGNKIQRPISLKIRPSKFPDEYMKFEPGESFSAALNLSKIFNIKTNTASVQYSCYNSDPSHEGSLKIESNIITMTF